MKTKIYFFAVVFAAVLISGCSKEEYITQEQDHEPSARVYTEEELTDGAGWVAMNDFRKKKEAYPEVTFDDIPHTRALWLMETTLNYDHGNTTDPEMRTTGLDSSVFSIDITAINGFTVPGNVRLPSSNAGNDEDTLLSGLGTLEAYIELENQITAFEDPEAQLILADIAFAGKDGNKAVFKVFRVFGKTNVTPAKEGDSRTINHGECWPGQVDISPSWDRISPKLKNPHRNLQIRLGEYFSDIQGLEADPIAHSNLWRGPNPDQCIYWTGYVEPYQEVVDDLGNVVSPPRYIRNVACQPDGPFGSGNNLEYHHIIKYYTAKLNRAPLDENGNVISDPIKGPG